MAGHRGRGGQELRDERGVDEPVGLGVGDVLGDGLAGGESGHAEGEGGSEGKEHSSNFGERHVDI